MSPLPPVRFLVTLGALLVLLATGLALVHRGTIRLRAAAADTAVRESELASLRAQRARVAAEIPDPAVLQTMRAAAQALETERAALATARAELQRASLESMSRPDVTPPAPAVRDVPSSRDRPEATMQSVMHAVQAGNADELAELLDFDPVARGEAEAFFASLPLDLQEEYTSPERLVAHVMAAKTFAHYASTQVVADTALGAEDHALRVALYRDNGQFRSATFQLHRAADGWRLRVPTRVIEGYRALVTGYVPVRAAAGQPDGS